MLASLNQTASTAQQGIFIIRNKELPVPQGAHNLWMGLGHDVRCRQRVTCQDTQPCDLIPHTFLIRIDRLPSWGQSA